MNMLRVLVVDDEPGMRHSIGRALRRYTVALPEGEGEVGFEVDTAESGEEALEKIEASRPDLMLLDYKLGSMTGIDVLERLGERETDVLTIMITAFATIETAVRATKKGAYDFVAKPFSPDELRETVRKAADHLLVQRRARELAEEKRRVRFEFISVLGHELKSPLAAVESYMNLLRDRALGEEVGGYEQIIERCLARTEGMRKLILDLLDMTRIESGEKKRELGDVDVRESVIGVVDGVKPRADERGIAIELQLDDDLQMTADRGEIEIVLNNLISNAVKYNRDQGRVEVRVSADAEWLTITVKDTGIGMSAEDAGRLFKDFVRIKNEQTRGIPGSGLGLSIVKKIADLYGGDVALESEPDVGSTFTVRLRRDFRPASKVKGDEVVAKGQGG